MSNLNQIPPSLQSLFSGAWAQAAGAANAANGPAGLAMQGMQGMPAMPSAPGMPLFSAMPPMSSATVTAPEAGWWWLPAVKPEMMQAAVTKWFSPKWT